MEEINKIHFDCHELCKMALGKYLPVAGNIGIFTHTQEEYDRLSEQKDEITFASDNPAQKYFLLKKPIVIPAEGDYPQAVYTHLYIRKPDPSSYGQYLGDIDFIIDHHEYKNLKQSVTDIKGAEIYDRPGWDTIQLTNPKINSVAYVSTIEFAEKVRVKFD